ncbi:hypothetical protein M8818_006967 [Zalaria obscura]|uniref:Uncharacterized protein n=1 Tax=Zalaria obscura TaxID=2024903 RepID=A0ACC3S6C2_9PEZI
MQKGGAASDTTYPSRNVSRESGIDWRQGSDESPPSPINELGDGEFSDFKFYAESGMSESPELKRAEVATYHSPHARTSDSKVNTQVAVVRMNTVRRHKASESFDANDDTRSIMSGHGVVETDAATDEESHYEDAPSEMPAVTPHEQREDAFDYQHFFLHSAMGTLSRSRSSSVSTASTMTARGPSTQDDLVPATPETPETLKLIERNLHKRTISADSLASVETFETAKEARSTPITPLDEAGRTQWPVLPTKDGHVRQRSGDRVDSGMGVRTLKRRSPPQSIHYAGIDMPQPPASVAVAALTDPKARQLGLKDKAMLFTLIESLKDLCLKLQTEDEGSYESKGLRRRLDEARRVLDGVPFADA